MIKVRVCTCAELIPDLVSWRIMRRTKYKASHAFLIYKDEIFEAADKGVYRLPVAGDKSAVPPIPALLDEHRIVDDIEINVPCTEEEFYAWWKTVEGKPYSTRQFGGFILPKWMHWMFRDGRRGAICTELVCWFLTDLMKWPNFDDEFKSPGQLVSEVKRVLGLP